MKYQLPFSAILGDDCLFELNDFLVRGFYQEMFEIFSIMDKGCGSLLGDFDYLVC
jgi:hypothetical protein